LCRILSVGSSEEYGNYTQNMLPIKEEYPLNPVSPYGVARVSQEQLSKVYCNGFNIDIILTRSFNHIGPGQKDVFVISSLAKQLVKIKKGIEKENTIRTGDITIVRDFLDVRDVVDAYHKLFQHGKSGEVYNVCGGMGTSIEEILKIITGILNIDIDIEIDKELLRPNDNKVIIGSNEKLQQTTGWQRKIPLKQSLEDIIAFWDEKLIKE